MRMTWCGQFTTRLARARDLPYVAMPADVTAGPVQVDAGVRQLLWRLSEGVIFSDVSQGHIVSMNPAAERMFGYTGAEVAGLPIDNLLPAALVRPGVSVEIRACRQDGS